MSIILVTGNPVDGFSAIGPFKYSEQAMQHGENLSSIGQSWWLATVEDEPTIPNPTHLLVIGGFMYGFSFALYGSAKDAEQAEEELEDIGNDGVAIVELEAP